MVRTSPDPKRSAKAVVVGPLPPPIGGATRSFEAFFEAWNEMAELDTCLINSSPKRERFKKDISIKDLFRGLRVLLLTWARSRKARMVLVFSTTNFFRRTGSFFIALKKWRRLKLAVSFFGSNLVGMINALEKRERERVLRCLKDVDAVIVETQLLGTALSQMGFKNVKVIPGYRRINAHEIQTKEPAKEGRLRTVYLGHIKREKGVFLACEAIKELRKEGLEVTCDFFGPIAPDDALRFHSFCTDVSGIEYKGILSGDVSNCLKRYDILVMPTSWQGEGHPGVVIEAMQAGIPVLTTRFRALPELIEDEKNGFLVDCDSIKGIVEVLRRLVFDPGLVDRMGKENQAKLAGHDVKRAARTVFFLLNS